MPITEDQFRIMQARVDRVTHREPAAPAPDDAADSEAEFQEWCQRDAEADGAWVHRTRMDLPTTGPLGTPDLICFFPGARILIVEAKARNRKLRPAQLGVKIKLEGLGFKVFVCRTKNEWLEAKRTIRQ